MKQELDDLLVKKYPKIFRNRHGDMRETLMCWGFEIGDGWFNIIDALCANIQSHIDWKRKDRASALRFNRALKRAIAGDKSALINHFCFGGKISDYAIRNADETIERASYRKVPDKVYQVIAVQVKEKFGTLRFYYDGGDEYVRALENMAESMSARTCEVCGNPGKVYRDGWHSTLCPTHAKEQHREEEEDESE